MNKGTYMSKTTKRQVAFYPDRDVQAYLDTLDQGTRTRAVNAAVRAWMESRAKVPRLAYEDAVESLVAWLSVQSDPVVVATKNKLEIHLARFLQKFLFQDRLRNQGMTWSEVIKQGITFPHYAEEPSVIEGSPEIRMPARDQARCASCQKPIYSAGEAINTPTRGRICRSCFELPLPR
jgi:hypothetical protein